MINSLHLQVPYVMADPLVYRIGRPMSLIEVHLPTCLLFIPLDPHLLIIVCPCMSLGVLGMVRKQNRMPSSKPSCGHGCEAQSSLEWSMPTGAVSADSTDTSFSTATFLTWRAQLGHVMFKKLTPITNFIHAQWLKFSWNTNKLLQCQVVVWTESRSVEVPF